MAAQTDPVVRWLLEGDAAIRWQVLGDLLGANTEEVERARGRIAGEGWGRRLLTLQHEDGLWGGGLYTPKWTSTTYTLLLLRALGLPPGNRGARTGAVLLLDAGLFRDGGINFWKHYKSSEACVSSMVLAIASRFAPEDHRIERLVEYLLEQQMPDGGWNCRRPHGATHSSLHTTISALEGLLEYEQCGGRMAHRTRDARERAHEFLFAHRLFRSHRTGKVIDGKMTRFSFPPHWHYDVLRGLDYLQAARARPDARASEAIELVERRRNADGRWLLQNVHHGKYHFELEPAGQPSRWNTLRAMRVLRWWEGESGAIAAGA